MKITVHSFLTVHKPKIHEQYQKRVQERKKKLITRKEAKRGHGHESKPTPNVGNLSVYCFSHVERTKILEAFKTSKVLN